MEIINVSMPQIERKETPFSPQWIHKKPIYDSKNNPTEIACHLGGSLSEFEYGEFYAILLIFFNFIDRTHMKCTIFGREA